MKVERGFRPKSNQWPLIGSRMLVQPLCNLHTYANLKELFSKLLSLSDIDDVSLVGEAGLFQKCSDLLATEYLQTEKSNSNSD